MAVDRIAMVDGQARVLQRHAFTTYANLTAGLDSEELSPHRLSPVDTWLSRLYTRLLADIGQLAMPAL